MAKTTKTTKKVTATKVATKKTEVAAKLSIDVLGLDGKATGKLTLPSELFGVKPNKQLLAQAVRVYLANQREGSANTKTRGEVEGSTRKIYKQKGTGRARHGSIRAHIFVGGGIVFGPVSHGFTMEFPTKMKRKAVASALSQQFQEGNVIVVSGLEGVTKTKGMAEALMAAGATASVLLVTAKDSEKAFRVARNISGVDIIGGDSLNAYTVISHDKVVFMKEAVGLLQS